MKLQDGILLATMVQVMVPMRQVERVDLTGGNPLLGSKDWGSLREKREGEVRAPH